MSDYINFNKLKWNGELPPWPSKMGDVKSKLPLPILNEKLREAFLQEYLKLSDEIITHGDTKSKPNSDYITAAYEGVTMEFILNKDSYKELNIGPPPKIEAEFKPLPEFPLIFSESDIEDPSV